ncbi:MAG: Hsp33 family molecular chaperone [Phenylobacterium sp.]|uniref:Hsp33 family molecular chaperone n=1 Tax=Phenylobacterium sp. TaxID=1871053 RepID=UPI0025FA17B5|nr:Hsp33 family molecular chaperone [Phenylobacterium sp.]MCA3732627.1 Hsp33 family molecular chaperone [Phenylobacterium sp.]MCA6244103.1 Hsp33 family molecular chaperone [Phenylobacterium sp.]MCA6271554.1 Hsp33 family molecular chaperone [Phenylobacterium sp.]MCA6276814.1 Hsp33 family molecular chaperone [Phenylobacterium sp.]MCA6294097.1 Hsp33 family molecular chaperone [Phenylobacterium sp.]
MSGRVSLEAVDDDRVFPFQIEGEAVRGRLVRLGPAVDEILSAHAYPDPVANLLGETCALAALVGSNLKFEGRLIVQAQGNGPVRYVVCDYDTAGSLRGYCRFDPEEVAGLVAGFQRPGARALLGDGLFMMTVDQGPDMDRYQGVTAIEGETLALCAEQYFAQSEQTPTRIRLAVGQADSGEGAHWRAGGVLIQNIAGDEARGSTEEPWRRTEALFETLGEDELIDPLLPATDLLFRLFHEDGVRVFTPQALKAACRCSQERILGLLASFSAEERADMVEADGRIRVSCEFCSRVYEALPSDLDAAGA